jgi:predicted Holliday junction resolvase-like endonuclease
MFESITFGISEWLAILLLIIIGFYLYRKSWQDHTKEAVKEAKEQKEGRQKAVFKGEITENLVPFIKEYTGCNGGELLYFGGKPIDWIGFQGLDEIDDKMSLKDLKDSGKKVTIKFFEVKNRERDKKGRKVSLKARGTAIREAIREGRVKWRAITVHQKDVDESINNLDIKVKE